MPCLLLRLWLGCFWSVSHQAAPSIKDAGVRVGTAAVELVADDAMVIAGGIHAGQAKGQEGLLRAMAMVLEKGRLRPSASKAELMVLAVYIPPQEPVPGIALRSTANRSSSEMRPALCSPTASNTLTIFRSSPSSFPEGSCRHRRRWTARWRAACPSCRPACSCHTRR